MHYKPKSLAILLLLSVAFLASCLKGIDPLPGKIGDLDLSLSIPVAKGEVHLSGMYNIGLPYYHLNLDIPEWAKYEYIYFTDTVTVDLYRIFQNSDDVKYLAFNIIVWNEFPAKGTLNLHFADNAGNLLYSFEPLEIEDGSVLYRSNHDVIVVRSGFSKSTTSFDKTKIDSLRTAVSLVYNLEVNLKDVNTNALQYFEQFKMDCHLGARIDFVLKDN